ncbi:MAG: CCA tRNA nucleotidyltransferase [Acetobacterales bacterium]
MSPAPGPATFIPATDWMAAASTRAVTDALRAAGEDLRFAGGCVRDAVLGRPAKDIDIATPAAPDRVTDVLEAAEVRVVPTGLSHGTVTAVVGGAHFEITTLRRDVETFGRHARVAFTDDWAADAARRDFTINALYAEMPAGGRSAIHDYHRGLEDLANGLVRFVGDPETRILEDRLRLLRFFRFHAHLGRGPADAAGLQAASRHAAELAGLSGERVRNELFRLLEAPDPLPTLRLMAEHGVLVHALSEAGRFDRLSGLLRLGEPDAADPLLRLGALLPDEAAAGRVEDRLRLSRAQGRRLAAMVAKHPDPDVGDVDGWRRAVHALGPAVVGDRLLLRCAEAPDGDRGMAVRAALDGWAPPPFPLGGSDVKALGILPGPRVGELLRDVEAWWAGRGFVDDRVACLARLRALL